MLFILLSFAHATSVVKSNNELNGLLAKPIPNVTSSFCDDNVDFILSSSGDVLSNFSYRLCIDVSSSSSMMRCTEGVPCPGGPNVALSVFTKGTLYNVDHTGKCVSKPCPSCAPPNGMPFSFLQIDGADGDTSRGVAKYVGNANIDGIVVDHFAHDRGQIVKGLGVMNWYLDGNDLIRNSYVEPTGGSNPGGSGNRDFSKNRLSPAPASSFVIPNSCNNHAINEADRRQNFTPNYLGIMGV